MVSDWGLLIMLGILAVIGILLIIIPILAFCGIYWGVVKSVDVASDAWQQRAEARQDQKWQAWQETQNPTTSLLRASSADINTPDVLVRPAMAEVDAKPEELLRPVDEETSF